MRQKPSPPLTGKHFLKVLNNPWSEEFKKKKSNKPLVDVVQPRDLNDPSNLCNEQRNDILYNEERNAILCHLQPRIHFHCTSCCQQTTLPTLSTHHVTWNVTRASNDCGSPPPPYHLLFFQKRRVLYQGVVIKWSFFGTEVKPTVHRCWFDTPPFGTYWQHDQQALPWWFLQGTSLSGKSVSAFVMLPWMKLSVLRKISLRRLTPMGLYLNSELSASVKIF